MTDVSMRENANDRVGMLVGVWMREIENRMGNRLTENQCSKKSKRYMQDGGKRGD